MKRNTINLAILRQRILSKRNVLQNSSFESQPVQETSRFSRRALLFGGGVAAIVAAPIAKKLLTFSIGSIEIYHDLHSCVFTKDGNVLWEIDSRKYCGNQGKKPEISVTKSENEVRISLTNARFPGTHIVADFELKLERGILGTKALFDFAIAQKKSEIHFEKWLENVKSLDLQLAGDFLYHKDSNSIVKDCSKVTFLPSNQFVFATCKLVSSAQNLPCEKVIISLQKNVESVYKTPYKHASFLEAKRETKSDWSIQVAEHNSTHWKVSASGDSFDSLEIEAHESNQGLTQFAEIFATRESGAELAVETHEGKDVGTVIPLVNPILVKSNANGEFTEHLFANFSKNRVWIHQENRSVAFADTEYNEHFELRVRNGLLQRVHCAPSIVSVTPKLAGVIVTSAMPSTPTLLSFVGGGAMMAQVSTSLFKGDIGKTASKIKGMVGDKTNPPGVYSIQYQGAFDKAVIQIGENYLKLKTALPLPSLSVIRPHDFLVLNFYYDNFEISAGTNPTLSPKNSSTEGTIVVEFQPQNIFEQAFFEADTKANTKPGTPDGAKSPDEDASSVSEDITQPPVRSRIAGSSRLAFSIPKGESIKLSLEADGGMLDWTKWTPKLVPVATREDVASSSTGFVLYPGLLTSLSKQGIKFSSSALLPKYSSLSNEDILSNLTSTSKSIASSKGISYKAGSSSGATSTSKSTGKMGGKSFSIDSYKIDTKVVGTLIKPKIKKPSDTETSIELPYRLMLSPLPHGGWAHSKKEVVRTLEYKTTDSSGTEKVMQVNFTELWHTRLWFKGKNGKVNERDSNYLLGKTPKLRAVWSPDWNEETTPPGAFPDYRGPLSSGDRWSIVNNTSNYYLTTTKKGKPGSPYDPKAIDAESLFLTSVGGFINSRGSWDPCPSIIDLIDWVQRGTMGRDHYVRVMYRGYLFPFGNQATLVKITERKFQKPFQRGTYGAYLRQRMFIIVRQPDVALDDTNTLFEFQGREIPFKNIHIKTVATPNIDNPSSSSEKIPGFTSNYTGYDFPGAFYPRVGGADFLFQCKATDWDGNIHDFTMPLAFILGSISNVNPGLAQSLVSWYSDTLNENHSRIKRDFNGAKVALSLSKKPGDSAFVTNWVKFSAGSPSTLPTDATWFYPKLRTANLKIDSVEQLAGQDLGGVETKLYNKYLQHEFDTSQNTGEVFMEFLEQVALSFGGAAGGSSDKSGGFVSPNQAIAGLSRAIGPVSGKAGNIAAALSKFSGNSGSFDFDPEEIFGALDAKLFGVISLFDIIQAVSGVDVRKELAKMLVPAMIGKQVFDLLSDPAALATQLQNEVVSKVEGAYNSAMADAESKASSIIAKLEELKELLDRLVNGLSNPAEVFNTATDTVPDILNWIKTNIGPLGLIPEEDLAKLEEVSKFLESLHDGIRIGFDWKPMMQADEFGFFVPADPANTFNLSAYAKIPISTEGTAIKIEMPPVAAIEAVMKNFTINLIPPIMDLIAIPVTEMGFRAKLGEKAEIFCTLDTIQFKGPLEFVNELQKYIPLDGFVDPPYINVDTSGIKIGFDLGIPDIAIGLFSLTNISLGAQLNLPFLGDSMTFRFEFCKRESPFHMTYCMLGGGGFFGLELSLDGITLIEAALEVGAQLSVDFGVASGGISIFAGIYFKMEGDVVTLTGYVKIHGEVDVLGLISASITLEMSLTYQSTGKLYGVATLTIEIEVFIFSGSVELTVEKYFKGSAGDPTIIQLMPARPYPLASKIYASTDLSNASYFRCYGEAFA